MTARVKAWLAYALAWTPAVLLYAISVAGQRNVTFAQGLGSGSVIMGAAAVQGVAVWWLTRRLPLPARNRQRLLFGLFHVLCATAYAALWLAVLLGWLNLVAPPNVALLVLRNAGLWHFLSGLYIYGLIAGVSYLIRAQHALRERSVAVARAEASAARAQLQAVRAQLQPHFLFNALHAVGGLLRQDRAAAERALEQLGDLLRHALDHSNHDVVPLADEWQFARDYLALEQLRLGDRLRVSAHIDQDALDTPVPPFLLQPLVENAVRHSIAPRVEGGTLHIAAQRANGTLTLRVRDDGPGADPANMMRSGGLGIVGVQRQLEARYGARAALRFERDGSNGFAAIVTLPADES